MAHQITIKLPSSMRPGFAKRVATGLTAPTPKHPADVILGLHAAGATPDHAYFQFEDRSKDSKTTRHCLVTLHYGTRRYRFIYQCDENCYVRVPAFISDNDITNYKWQSNVRHVAVYPTLMDRFRRLFAFREV